MANLTIYPNTLTGDGIKNREIVATFGGVNALEGVMTQERKSVEPQEEPKEEIDADLGVGTFEVDCMTPNGDKSGKMEILLGLPGEFSKTSSQKATKSHNDGMSR